MEDTILLLGLANNNFEEGNIIESLRVLGRIGDSPNENLFLLDPEFHNFNWAYKEASKAKINCKYRLLEGK